MMRFGTDGIRGVAGHTPVDVQGAVAIGRAAGRLSPSGAVLVARDRRPSGEALEAAVIAGIVDVGATARVAGVLPTAGASEAVAQGLGDVAVVLTASHNPADDNGFKLLLDGGRKPTDEEVAEIERLLADNAPGGELGSVEPVPEAAVLAHIQALSERLDLGALRGHRLAIDLANGAAVALAPWLEGLGVDWVFVADGDGVENEACGAVHPEALGEAVRQSGARAGLAVDGDADRCVLVDERGQPVHGDVLGWWLLEGMGLDSVAATVMSTHALEPALPQVRVTRTPVGDRHLQAAMREHGLALGYEESGHVLFADGLPTGCGLLTGLRALIPLLRSEVPVSTQLGGFVPWPRKTAKVRVADRPPLDEVAALQDAIREVEGTLAGGRTLLRYSGTEPVLRILVEGPDTASVQAGCARLLTVATASLG
ncbi:MAG: phosphoglucosamine mutase [Deltaproteobacteria bacterium]|nr:MAG: phosphoglucosamine mutase [Deltaproteobacteria bacterium]